ncbi:DUF4431 domain-containing protein [Acinetobacter sp. F16]|uniref:DUF4431 domain-containing protein n=1 Tax=Acinetobacter sp. F16 TaxID=3462438 RepID=UPI0040468AC4
MVLILPIFSRAQTFYYDKPAFLHGKLLKIKSLHPNQEVFGGNQIAVALDRVIKVDGAEGLVKTKLIQLIDMNESRYFIMFKNEGIPVAIACEELFRGHTAHHTTKVLCVVKAVQFK